VDQSAALTPISKKYYQFLLSHAAFGVSAAIVYSPATGIAAHWFLRRRSTAVAVIMSGAGAGGVVYPILIKNLTDRFGGCPLGRADLSMARCHPHPRGHPLCPHAPRVSVHEEAPAQPAAGAHPRPRPPMEGLPVLLPHRRAVVYFHCVSRHPNCTDTSVFSPYFNAALYARANRASPTVVGYAVAILQAGNFIGRMASGPLADRFGVWLIFVGFAILSAIALFAFFIAPMGTPATVAGLAIYGAVSGGHVTLIPAVTASISPAHEIGMRLGLLWTVLSVTMLVGPVISGELVGAGHGTYKWAGLWNALMFCCSSAILSVPGYATWRRERQKSAE
jgi:MFS family permease